MPSGFNNNDFVKKSIGFITFIPKSVRLTGNYASLLGIRATGLWSFLQSRPPKWFVRLHTRESRMDCNHKKGSTELKRERRFVVCWFSFLFVFFCLAGTAWSEGEKDVLLLYTGNFLGQVTPVPG